MNDDHSYEFERENNENKIREKRNLFIHYWAKKSKFTIYRPSINTNSLGYFTYK
jgi:hypothetical protein